jgi:hypothetical protein
MYPLSDWMFDQWIRSMLVFYYWPNLCIGVLSDQPDFKIY